MPGKRERQPATCPMTREVCPHSDDGPDGCEWWDYNACAMKKLSGIFNYYINRYLIKKDSGGF